MNNCTKEATSSTVSHSCNVTPYQTVFFIRTSISPVHLHSSTVYCYCLWWNWQNTEQNVQCSSLSLYRQTVYSGQYSGHCVVLVLLIEWLLFIVRQYIWLCVDKLLVVQWATDWLHAAEFFLRRWCYFNSSRNSSHFADITVHYSAHNSPSVDHSARPVQSISSLHSILGYEKTN